MWEKVLIADDDVDIRDKFYQILSSLCYKVTCVPTGKEVLLRLTEERFDLILLDQYMPQLNGLDTAKDIRKFDKDVKIVLLLDGGEPQDFQDSGESSFSAVVKKDFATHFMMKEILGVLKEPQAVKSDEQAIEVLKQKKILLIDDNPEFAK